MNNRFKWLKIWLEKIELNLLGYSSKKEREQIYSDFTELVEEKSSIKHMPKIIFDDVQVCFTDGKYRSQGFLVNMTIDKTGKVVKMIVANEEELTTRVLVEITPCKTTGNMPSATIIF